MKVEVPLTVSIDVAGGAMSHLGNFDTWIQREICTRVPWVYHDQLLDNVGDYKRHRPCAGGIGTLRSWTRR